MKELKDVLGRQLNAGDKIVYFVRGSTGIRVRMATIKFIHDYGDEAYERYTLAVRASGKSIYSRAYNTTLTSNKTIVKLDKDTKVE